MNTQTIELEPPSFRKAMLIAYGLTFLLEVACFPLVVMLINAISPHVVVTHQAVLLVYFCPPFLAFALPLMKARYRNRQTLLAIGAGVASGVVSILAGLMVLLTWLFNSSPMY